MLHLSLSAFSLPIYHYLHECEFVYAGKIKIWYAKTRSCMERWYHIKWNSLWRVVNKKLWILNVACCCSIAECSVCRKHDFTYVDFFSSPPCTMYILCDLLQAKVQATIWKKLIIMYILFVENNNTQPNIWQNMGRQVHM